jgi:homoserine kinase type II
LRRGGTSEVADGAPTSTPVSWAVDDVRRFLRAYGRSPERLGVEQLPSWWFNTILRIDADGELLVLRRYGITPPDEVRWELALLTLLRAHDFPTISPLPLVHPGATQSATDAYLADFLGKPAILYPFVEGQSAKLGGVEHAVAIPQTAAVVARLHELTVGLSLPHPRVQSGTDSRRLLRELPEHVAQRHSSPGVALREMVQCAARVERELSARLVPYVARPHDLPRGIVHHDAHWANVIFREDRLVALIDFDDACEGYLLADLSAMVANWAASPGEDALDPARAGLVIREYERHRQLTPVERVLLPDFVAAFILADGTAYVRERLEQGAADETAVTESDAYRRFRVHAGDADRFRAFRALLRLPEW